MRVLLLEPCYDRSVTDISYAFLYSNRADLDALVVTTRDVPAKGIWRLPRYEDADGIPVHRLYRNFFEMSMFPQKSLSQILRLARDFGPEVIFCSLAGNMRIAVALKKHLGTPIVLAVEYAGNIALNCSRSRRQSVFMQVFGVPYGSGYWKWLSKWSDAVITFYPNDQYVFSGLSRFGAKMFFVPWCNAPSSFIVKNRVEGRAMYAGMFSKFKNTEEFLQTIPFLMEETPTKEFVFLGSGSAHDVRVVETLRKKYGTRIQHLIALPRVEAMKLLSGCHYAYTPVRTGGWGFIGDCWATRTPLVMTHNDYCATAGVDTMVTSPEDIAITVNEIYGDQDLYRSLQESGYKHYLKEHTVESVGHKIMEVVTYVHEKKQAQG
jgi:glycosyltransferase involved in cell wall biosynthesis